MANSITQQAKNAVSEVLQAGDIAVDATVGNGHDTLFLAKLVGEQGHVFGFDIQHAAIMNTNSRLLQEKVRHCTLFSIGHEHLRESLPKAIHGRIRAMMFNLGYLPGSDKVVVTRTESTLSALRDALDLLAIDGVLTVVAYPGHSGGEEEADAVAELLLNLQQPEFTVQKHSSEAGRTLGPTLWVVRKRSE